MLKFGNRIRNNNGAVAFRERIFYMSSGEVDTQGTEDDQGGDGVKPLIVS